MKSGIFWSEPFGSTHASVVIASASTIPEAFFSEYECSTRADVTFVMVVLRSSFSS